MHRDATAVGLVHIIFGWQIITGKNLRKFVVHAVYTLNNSWEMQVTNLPIAKKSLGQHWLTDTSTLQTICETGDINQADTILEIGPGTGTLTSLLVEQAKKVVAVEFDQVLAVRLPERIKSSNLEVVNQDILNFNLTSLPKNYKVIANIPYYLTSQLIRVISESTNPAKTVVILVQKEVAQRVAAKTGSMSLLSVSAQFYWDVSLGIEVKAELFNPKPKIDSQILVLKRPEKIKYPDVQSKLYFRLVKSGFVSRRKTLLNSLSAGLRMDKQIVNQAIVLANIDPGLRAQALSLDDWYNLYIICLTKKLL